MNLTQSLTVMGLAEQIDPAGGRFTIRCSDESTFQTFLTTETTYWVLQNLDGVNNDQVPDPEGFDGSPGAKMRKYLRDGRLVVTQGVATIGSENDRLDARTVRLLASGDDPLLFESSHWWLTQCARLADQ